MKFFIGLNNTTKIILLILWLGLAGDAWANNSGARINTVVDTTHVLIGMRVVLTVEVIHQSGAKIVWPHIKKSLYNFEVLHQEITTTTLNKGWEKQRLKATLTNFTPGTHAISALPVTVSTSKNTLVLHSKQVPIVYNMPSVDLNRPFKDIQPSVEIEYTHAELLPYKIGTGLLLILIFIFILKYAAKLYHWIGFPRRAPPFYRQAMTSLMGLEKRADVHTELSVILRAYVKERFAISSKSATTKEILFQLENLRLGKDSLSKITTVLEVTDSAKFGNKKVQSFDKAILLKASREFVQGTKPIR